MIGYTKYSVGLDRNALVKVVTVRQNTADSLD